MLAKKREALGVGTWEQESTDCEGHEAREATGRQEARGEIEFYLAQFLNGYGCFRSYPYKMVRGLSPNSLHSPGVVNDTEYTLYTATDGPRENHP